MWGLALGSFARNDADLLSQFRRRRSRRTEKSCSKKRPGKKMTPKGCDFIDAARMSVAGNGVDGKGASNIRSNAKLQDTNFA